MIAILTKELSTIKCSYFLGFLIAPIIGFYLSKREKTKLSFIMGITLSSIGCFLLPSAILSKFIFFAYFLRFLSGVGFVFIFISIQSLFLHWMHPYEVFIF